MLIPSNPPSRRQYFDTRRQILDTFETQLRFLLASLSAAAKVRHSLQESLNELQSAFLGLSQCDLSGPLRKALEDAANVQKRLWELSEEQSASEDQIGGLTSVAEVYARLCASARVSHIYVSSRSERYRKTDWMSFFLVRRGCLALASKPTMSGKRPSLVCARPRRLTTRRKSRDALTRSCSVSRSLRSPR